MRSGLNHDLELYAAQARQRDSKAATGKLPAFATAAGAALAMTTGAEAGIIYSGTQNVTVQANEDGQAQSVGLDIQNPGGHASSLKVFLLDNTSNAHTAALRGVAGKGSVIATGGILKRFSSGAKISGGKATSGIINKMGFHGGSSGNFAQSVVGFAGFMLANGDNGWIRLKFEEHFGYGDDYVTVIAIDWAYNDTPGAPITAGEGLPSAVPEPSTLTLALLAAGSAGVLALRNRRRAVAAADRSPSE